MSSPMPYCPMERRKLATEAQIQAMLARMKEGPRAPAPLPEPVSEPVQPQIEWEKPVRNADGTGYCLSKCKGWSVTKVFSNQQPKYQAWRLREEWKFCMGTKDSAEEAKALCKLR